MNPRRVWLMARKETWHILRDVRTVYMALGIPLVLLLLFGYALTTDVEHVRLLAVDEDRTPQSRELVSAFQRSGLFRVVASPVGAAGLNDALHRGQARAALVVPRGYARTLDRGQEASVQLVVDGTNANDATIALGYAAALAQDHSLKLLRASLARRGLTAGAAVAPPLDVRPRYHFNPALRSQWYLVPGLIAVILAMVNTLLMALTVAREWERGTMEQLLVTPVRRSEILLGKLLPYFALGLGQLVLVASAGVLLFEVPLRGSLLLLLGCSSLALVAALAQGLLISVVVRNQQVAMQLGILSSMLPALLLSGFMSPIASMPAPIQAASQLVPARHFLFVLRGLFLKGVDAASLLPQVGVLALFAVVLAAASVLAFPRRLDR